LNFLQVASLDETARGQLSFYRESERLTREKQKRQRAIFAARSKLDTRPS